MRKKIISLSMEDESGNYFDDGASAESTGSSSAAPEENAENVVDEKPDNKPSEVDDLNVDKLAKSEAKEYDQFLKKMADDKKEYHRAIQDIRVINVGVEAYKDAYLKKDLPAVKLAFNDLENHLSRISLEHGFAPHKVVSVESDYLQSFSISFEKIIVFIKQLIDKVLMFINKVFAWLKSTYQKAQSNALIIGAANAKAKQVFLQWRRNHGDSTRAEIVQSKRYADFIELGFYKKALTMDGKQPGFFDQPLYHSNRDTGRKAFLERKTTYGIEIGKFTKNGNYLDAFIRGFPSAAMSEYSAAVDMLLKEESPEKIKHMFDTSWQALKAIDTFAEFHETKPGTDETMRVYRDTDVTDGYQYYSTYSDLGDWKNVLEYRVIASNMTDDYDGQMDRLGSTRITFVQNKDVGPSDNWMRYIETDEALDGFQAIEALIAEMRTYRKRMEAVEGISNSFRKNLDRLVAGSTSRKLSDYATDARIEKFEKTTRSITLTVNAYQAVIDNLSRLTGPWLVAATGLSTAWYYYIRTMIEEEQKFLKL